MVLPFVRLALAALAALVLGAVPAARADTVDARCDVYPLGEDHARAALACRFSQRQGYVTIHRADGVVHELSPGDAPGRYTDAAGRPAWRERGLGRRGLILRLADERLFVYWDTAGLPAASAP